MRLILALATKGFVSSFDEEDYDWTSIFDSENKNENNDDGDNGTEEDMESEQAHEGEREIFEEDDIRLVREYL
jgi:hypothetical protein